MLTIQESFLNLKSHNGYSLRGSYYTLSRMQSSVRMCFLQFTGSLSCQSESIVVPHGNWVRYGEVIR